MHWPTACGHIQRKVMHHGCTSVIKRQILDPVAVVVLDKQCPKIFCRVTCARIKRSSLNRSARPAVVIRIYRRLHCPRAKRIEFIAARLSHWVKSKCVLNQVAAIGTFVTRPAKVFAAAFVNLFPCAPAHIAHIHFAGIGLHCNPERVPEPQHQHLRSIAVGFAVVKRVVGVAHTGERIDAQHLAR